MCRTLTDRLVLFSRTTSSNQVQQKSGSLTAGFHLCPGTIILLQLYLLYLLMRNLWSTQFFNLFNHYKQVFLLELYHRVKGFKCPLTNHWTKNVPIYYFGWTWNCTYKYYSILDYIYPVCLFLIGFLAD